MAIKEELELKLKKIKSDIRNCEWDLKYNFKDNNTIQNKLLKLKEREKQTEEEIEQNI